MFARLAKMLGVAPHQLEDALQSEKRAKAQLSRRGLLALGASACATAILPERAWSFARVSSVPMFRATWLWAPEMSVRIPQGFLDALRGSSIYEEVLNKPLFP